MKKIIYAMVLSAAAAVVLSACSQSETEEQQNVKGASFSYGFEVSGEAQETKTTFGAHAIDWESGDSIGVYAVASGAVKSANQTAPVDVVSSPNVMTVKSTQALVAGDKIYSYYPYSSANGADPTAIKMSIPTTQVNGDADAAPLVGLPFTMTAEAQANTVTPIGKINYCNLASGMMLKIYSSDSKLAVEKVKKVVFNADQAIAGDFTFDITKVDYENKSTLAISGYAAQSVTTTASNLTLGTSADATPAVVGMILAPGSYTGTIQVFTDSAFYTYNVTAAKTFIRSAKKILTVDLKNAAVRSSISVLSSYSTELIHGLSWLNDSTLAVSNRRSHNIVALNVYTEKYTEIGKADKNNFAHPWLHKLGPDGKLYVAYKANAVVGTVDPKTDAVATKVLSSLTNCMDVDFDAAGNFYVLCRNLMAVYKYPKNSINDASKSVFVQGDQQFYCMEFDHNGNLLIGRYKSGIDMVSPDGTVTHIVGALDKVGDSDGVAGQPLTAVFNQVASMAVDAAGNIYLVDNNGAGNDKANNEIKVVRLGKNGYKDATVETLVGRGVVADLPNALTDVVISKDQKTLYFTAAGNGTIPLNSVLKLNLK